MVETSGFISAELLMEANNVVNKSVSVDDIASLENKVRAQEDIIRKLIGAIQEKEVFVKSTLKALNSRLKVLEDNAAARNAKTVDEGKEFIAFLEKSRKRKRCDTMDPLYFYGLDEEPGPSNQQSDEPSDEPRNRSIVPLKDIRRKKYTSLEEYLRVLRVKKIYMPYSEEDIKSACNLNDIPKQPTYTGYYEVLVFVFIDIVNYTTRIAQRNARQTAQFLQAFHTHLDSVIDRFNVCKMDIFGDGLFIVSGRDLNPEKATVHYFEDNLLQSVEMTLEVFEAMNDFIDKDDPENKVELRAGIHLGDAAGFVGKTVDGYYRHCLAGFNMNLAARLQTTSEPARIQISEPLMSSLNVFFGGKYSFKRRGIVELKNAGPWETFWLSRA